MAQVVIVVTMMKHFVFMLMEFGMEIIVIKIIVVLYL
nr:MAG TPA: hypothetical protein [Caudoviricetes sp.]